jgi:soluble calcium-activated nucleotidase 1
LKKWVFLPRRISHEAYDENKDEKMGGNKLVLVDESFTKTEVVELKDMDLDPLKGFSTFAFVPGTSDRHAIAIRSVEENCVDFTPQCQQRSYFIVFDVLSGQVLSDELEYEDKVKFEGIEFVDIYTQPAAGAT